MDLSSDLNMNSPRTVSVVENKSDAHNTARGDYLDTEWIYINLLKTSVKSNCYILQVN